MIKLMIFFYKKYNNITKLYFKNKYAIKNENFKPFKLKNLWSIYTLWVIL